jgi:hypothetical protein
MDLWIKKGKKWLDSFSYYDIIDNEREWTEKLAIVEWYTKCKEYVICIGITIFLASIANYIWSI